MALFGFLGGFIPRGYVLSSYRRIIAHLKSSLKIIKKQESIARRSKNSQLQKRLKIEHQFLIQLRDQINQINSKLHKQLVKYDNGFSGAQDSMGQDLHDTMVHERNQQLQEAERDFFQHVNEIKVKVKARPKLTDEQHRAMEMLWHDLNNYIEEFEKKEAERKKRASNW